MAKRLDPKLINFSGDPPPEQSKAFAVEQWDAGAAGTPIQSFEFVGKLHRGAFPTSEIEVAPWVRDAYAAENGAREKKKLRPLGWTRFCNILMDDKLRKKTLVAGKIMDSVLKAM